MNACMFRLKFLLKQVNHNSLYENVGGILDLKTLVVSVKCRSKIKAGGPIIIL